MTPTALGALALALSASVLAAGTRLAARPAAPLGLVGVRLAPVAESCVSGWANYGNEENKLRGISTIAEPWGDLAVGAALDSVKLVKDKTERWFEWDVSEWVLRERAAGRHVVTLVLEGNDVAFFHSRESKTNPPELVLVP